MSIRKGTTIIAGNASSNEWTGTLEEYNIALENGTIKENMICYITDDILYAEDFKPELDNKANIDLSNLSPTGEARFASGLNNKITNCLLEVPQRIKVELNNGTFTTKAGSVFIVPDGFEADGITPKFDYITIPYDVNITIPISGSAMFVYNTVTNGYDYMDVSLGFSGSSHISSTGGISYNIATNNVKIYSDANVVYSDKVSLPFVIVTGNGSQITSIDQVFNGMGYIGSTVWIDKGIKALIPNGRNEDGTLNNIEFQNNALDTITYTNDIKGVYFGCSMDGAPQLNGLYSYDEKDNYVYNGENKVPVIYCGTYDVVGGKITNFQPKQPFRAVDYNDLTTTITNTVDFIAVDWSKKVDKTVSTTYTAECNGYVIAWGSPQGNNDLNCTINGQSVFNLNFHGLSGAGYAQGFTLPVAKGDTYSVVGANGQYYFLPFKEA